MAAVTTAADIKLRVWDGKGLQALWLPASNGSLTAATATSGHFSNSFNPNSIGSTLPGTIVGFQLPNTTDDLRALFVEGNHAAADGMWLARFYRFGTGALSTTGDRLTHDSTFTRLRRTVFGTANTNIPLIPVIYITAATATTAPTYTVTYVDQDGNSVTSPNNVCPAAVTAAQGLYNIIMNENDHAVLDITQLNVSVAATAGTFSLYGVELIAPINTLNVGAHSYADLLYGGMGLNWLQPATPDSGVVTSALGIYCTSNLGTGATPIRLLGFNNT